MNLIPFLKKIWIFIIEILNEFHELDNYLKIQSVNTFILAIFEHICQV